MSQKYKFFVKDRSVVIQRSEAGSDAVDTSANVVIEALRSEDSEHDVRVFKSLHLAALFEEVKAAFTFLRAGGGYVLNERDQLLMIHRRGSWDLPKGKVDPGETIEETAVREVEEECGIDGLEITSEPFYTYHLYEQDGDQILKESVWFRMRTHEQSLVPQTEEDIEQATWVDLPVPQELRSGAYASIREVLDHFTAEAP